MEATRFGGSEEVRKSGIEKDRMVEERKGGRANHVWMAEREEERGSKEGGKEEEEGKQ